MHTGQRQSVTRAKSGVGLCCTIIVHGKCKPLSVKEVKLCP